MLLFPLCHQFMAQSPIKKYIETYDFIVLNYKLKHIHWFNYFGGQYLIRYGKEFFLEAPVWSSRMVNNDGIIIQQAPEFISKDPLKSEKRILDYINQQVQVELTWP